LWLYCSQIALLRCSHALGPVGITGRKMPVDKACELHESVALMTFFQKPFYCLISQFLAGRFFAFSFIHLLALAMQVLYLLSHFALALFQTQAHLIHHDSPFFFPCS
jgi:hypothetical protein